MNNELEKIWVYVDTLSDTELKETLVKSIFQNNQLKSDLKTVTDEYNDFRRQHIGDGKWDRY